MYMRYKQQLPVKTLKKCKSSIKSLLYKFSLHNWIVRRTKQWDVKLRILQKDLLVKKGKQESLL